MRHAINWNDVAHRTLEAMEARNMEPKELAYRAGISKMTVYKILKPEPVTLDSICSIADALNTTPDFLLGYRERKGQI